MTREIVVQIGNKILNNTLTTFDIIQILQEYCKDNIDKLPSEYKSRAPQAISKAISMLCTTNMWKPYFDKALRYYKAKYAVIECYSAPQTTLGNIRKLLCVY